MAILPWSGLQIKSESMSQVYAFLLDLVRHARKNGIDLPKVGAYDDVCTLCVLCESGCVLLCESGCVCCVNLAVFAV